MEEIPPKRKDVNKNNGTFRRRPTFRIWVLMLAMVVFILAGCSSGSDSSGDTDDGTTTGDGKSGVYEQDGGDVTESKATYAATETDESAVYVYGAGTYTLTGGTLTKTGDNFSNGDYTLSGGGTLEEI